MNKKYIVTIITRGPNPQTFKGFTDYHRPQIGRNEITGEITTQDMSIIVRWDDVHVIHIDENPNFDSTKEN